jgi:hypothetical protein
MQGCHGGGVESGDLSFSVQLLLPLSHLTKLQIEITEAEAECEALGQLSSLPHLQELGVSCYASGYKLGLAAAAAWAVLPLQKLELSNVSASLLQQLTNFQGLTRLCLVNVDAMQVTAVISQLPNLRSFALKLSVSGVQSPPFSQRGTTLSLSNAQACAAFETVAALLQAIGGLQELAEVCVSMQLRVDSDGPALQQFDGLCWQLLPRSLVQNCQLRQGPKRLTMSICAAADAALLWPAAYPGHQSDYEDDDISLYNDDHEDVDNGDYYQPWYAL